MPMIPSRAGSRNRTTAPSAGWGQRSFEAQVGVGVEPGVVESDQHVEVGALAARHSVRAGQLEQRSLEAVIGLEIEAGPARQERRGRLALLPGEI
jgi:hypothetical protein